jgi:hypothetical protein
MRAEHNDGGREAKTKITSSYLVRMLLIILERYFYFYFFSVEFSSAVYVERNTNGLGRWIDVLELDEEDILDKHLR